MVNRMGGRGIRREREENERKSEGGEERGAERGSKRERDIERKREREFVCLFVWFLNVLVNY